VKDGAANDDSGARTRSAGAALWTNPVRSLLAAERMVFWLVGTLFFVAAFVLGIRAIADLWSLAVAPHDQLIAAGIRFLDVMLLSLMIVELAYTVILSLRGAALLAEPFLLVGLIAVVRRMLVITIGDVAPGAPTLPGGAATIGGTQPIELGILTAVVLVLVVSIVLLRRRPREPDDIELAAHETGGAPFA
jgi:uncharacterized membrane protein